MFKLLIIKLLYSKIKKDMTGEIVLTLYLTKIFAPVPTPKPMTLLKLKKKRCYNGKMDSECPD